MRGVHVSLARNAVRALRLHPTVSPLLARSVLAGVRSSTPQPATRHATAAVHTRGFAADSTTAAEEPPHPTAETHEQEREEEEEGPSVGEAEQSDREQLLSAALAHVPRLGWSVQALWAGADDVGLSAAAVGILPRAEAQLVEHHEQCCTAAVTKQLEQSQELFADMTEAERIQAALRMRLELTLPFVSSWPQALSVQAQPGNVLEALRLRAVLVDELCHGAGLASADMSWYGDRAMLGAVYSSAELFLLTDGSPELADTWQFLARSVKAALEARTHSAHAGAHLAEVVGTLGARFSDIAQAVSQKRYP